MIIKWVVYLDAINVVMMKMILHNQYATSVTMDLSMIKQANLVFNAVKEFQDVIIAFLNQLMELKYHNVCNVYLDFLGQLLKIVVQIALPLMVKVVPNVMKRNVQNVNMEWPQMMMVIAHYVLYLIANIAIRWMMVRNNA